MREYIKQALRLPSFEEWKGASFGTAKDFRDYDLHLAAKFPRRFKIYSFLYNIQLKTQFGRRLREAKYWLYYRFHPKHKYTTMKLKRLEPGYYDEDLLLMYFMFELFETFMKRQFNNPSHVWEYSEEHFKDFEGNWIGDEEGCRKEIERRNAIWEEMKTIYHWWTVDYPDRENRLPKFPELPKEWGFMAPLNEDFDGTPQMSEWDRVRKIRREMEEAWEKEDEDMMHRLIKIRKVLWD